MPTPEWRLKLDVPHSFAVEPGWSRALHANNFRTDAAETQGVWRDPVTGLVSLRPSFLDPNWDTQLRPLSSWRYSVNYWTTLKVGQEFTTGAANVLATQTPYEGVAPEARVLSLLVDVALVSIASALVADEMVWALESLFDLAEDEGFVLHWRMLIHGNRRYKNALKIQWDNIGLHLSLDGVMSVYRYDRANMTAEPVFVEDFQIGSPTELADKDSYLYFIPIAGYGLVVYHSGAGQKFAATTSTSQAGTTRGKLIRWQDEATTSGRRRLFRSSKVRIGLNKSIQVHYNLGFQGITYNASGTWLGEIFDPGYNPSLAPAALNSIRVPTGRGDATCTLRKPDNSGAWTGGADRQGRILATLTTLDTRYTPWLLGTFVGWAPVMNVRNTTPVLVDGDDGSLTRLEISHDEIGRVAGDAEIFAFSADLARIVERGDTTWQVERCDDPDAISPVWVVQGGGLASMEQPAQYFLDAGGGYYKAALTLSGMEKRFDEVHNLNTAFDGMSVGRAINTVLSCSGFEGLASTPAYANAVIIPGTPADSDDWKWGVNFGDSGEEIIKKLLLYLRTQRSEYRLRYDWSYATAPLWKGRWVLEKKPRDTSAGATWTITPFEDEVDEVERIIPFGGSEMHLFTLKPGPPEGNLLSPFGLTGTNPNKAERVPGTPIYNVASLTDPLSPDFLGRVKMIAPFFPEVADTDIININGRRMYDMVAHRRMETTLPLRDWHNALAPATQVKVRGIKPGESERSILFTTWVKRKTLLLELAEDGCMVPKATLACDDVWESNIDE